MLSEKNSKKISILSFFLCMGVMYIHAFNLNVYGITDENEFLYIFERFTNKLAGGICVPYFFTISGFLFFKNYSRDKFKEKIKKRMYSIVVPYVVWNFIYYIFFAIIAKMPFILRYINSASVQPLGVIPLLKYIWSGYYTLWFLRTLIIMILLSPLLWKVLKHKNNYYFSEIIIFTLILIEWFFPGVIKPSFFSVYYVIGSYIGINYTSYLDYKNKKFSQISAIIVIGMLPFTIQLCGNIIYNILFIIMSWCALDLFKFSRNILWWMKNTFMYYCGHDIILESIEKIFFIMGGCNVYMAFFSYILSPIITVCILILVNYVLKRWCKPLHTILNGGR